MFISTWFILIKYEVVVYYRLDEIICVTSTKKSGNLWENNLRFNSFEEVKMNSWLLHVLSVMVVFCCRDALSCPKLCTCHFSAKTTEVVCPDAGLSHFPGDGLPGNTTSLTIQFTNLSVLTSQHLTAIPLLEELHLPGNKLSSLPADLLKGLHYLHTIDLTGVCV